MTAVLKRAVNSMVAGANSLFLGDTTLLKRKSWIEDDSEAIKKDWEAVGMDWKNAINIYTESQPDVAKTEQKKKARNNHQPA